MKYKFNKSDFVELPLEDQKKIDLLCRMIYNNEGFECLFEFLLNSHITEEILKNVELVNKGENIQNNNEIYGTTKIIHIMDFIRERAELSESLPETNS